MESAMKAIAEKRKRALPRPVFDRRRRSFAYAVGGIVLFMGVLLFASGWRNRSVSEKDILYAYTFNADSAYRVRLHPNDIYEEEWLPEERMYSAALTDYIEVCLRSELRGQGSIDAELGGNYTLTAVLEGFYTKEDVRKQIYEKRFPLREGKMQREADGSAAAEETVNIFPAEYAAQLERIENTLGGSTERSCYLLFSGDCYIDTETERRQEQFSYALPLPLLLESGFYTMEKPETAPESGEISKSGSRMLGPSPARLLGGGLLFALGLGGLLFTRFFTRLPSEEDAWRLSMKRLLRRYGSRLVFLIEPEEESGKPCCRIQNMDSLLLIAEELRQPVLCSLDERGCPRNGRFSVYGQETCYVLLYAPPMSIPLSE